MVPSTPHSGLILHTSNRLERLADRLAELIADPLRSPLLPEIVIVQSDGMRRWLTMFAQPVLSRMPQQGHDAFFQHVEERLRPGLCPDGTWHADYRRIRVVARRGVGAA